MTMPLQEFTAAETERLGRIEAAPFAPEAWRRSRCGVKECAEFGTHRVDMPESWYVMCEPHAREHAPAVTR